jgi:hypothetical protein
MGELKMMAINKYKKVYVIGLAFAMLLVSCLYVYDTNKPITQLTIQGKHVYYNNVDDLEAKADLIIVGASVKEFSEYTPTITYNESGRYENFYTITDVKVSKVLKGQYQNNTIPVLQNAAIDKKEKIMLVDDGYSVMEKNKGYLLFLKKSPLEGYYILGINQGKHNIDNTDNNEKETMKKDSFYKNLRQEVSVRFSDKLFN